MIAVIFEVLPRPERRDDYFHLAADLLPELEKIEGFVTIERFESLAQPGKILSLSFWRDEGAIKRWRTLSAHREAQLAGRRNIFLDYRLRVAAVARDYSMHDRAHVPKDLA